MSMCPIDSTRCLRHSVDGTERMHETALKSILDVNSKC